MKLTLLLSIPLAFASAYLALSPELPTAAVWIMSPGSYIVFHAPPPISYFFDSFNPQAAVIGVNFVYYTAIIYLTARQFILPGKY